jgi:IS6 family transposase
MVGYEFQPPEFRRNFGSVANRTIGSYEAMHAIRKGQIRRVPKGDPVAQRQFIHTIFCIAA